MLQGRRVNSFRLDQTGLARVFGELEAAVMETVWSLGEASVSDVCVRLGADSNYKTVMTVMNRLVEKDALSRHRHSRAYLYSAVESRDDLVSRVSRRVVEGLVMDFGDLAVAQFVDTLDSVDPELLAQLEQMIRARSEGAIGPAGKDRTADGSESE